MAEQENQFKQKLENFIAGIGKLQTKFGLEGKLMLNQSMTPIPLNDGSVRVFQPGFHLGNLTEAEVKVMDMALMQWVVYANLCMKKDDIITKAFADKMEVVYNFLTLRYRPFIETDSNQGFSVRYKPTQSQISVERIHGRFSEYLETLEGETIGEDADSEEAEEDVDAMEKGLEIENALIGQQRGGQKKRQVQLDKLKKEVEENYSNENAGKLYGLLGDCEGFWQIVNRGIEKRRDV